MKELSIEQKSQRYDEALKAAVVAHKDEDKHLKATLERIFPELKESEGEKIKNQILYAVRQLPICEETKDKCIAWLEKQGEQKVANKVEPKFHEGDWVIDKQGIAHQIANVVENVTNHTYGYNIVGGGYFNDNTEGIRLWTIQDAKVGDVLASKGGEDILIFRNLDTNTSFSSYYNITGKGEIGWSNSSFIPATKEQRDLLFQKMKEAGYEWDADKKKPKKIEQKPAEEVNDEDVRDFAQYIRKLGDDYELNLPNRDYDIYAVAKDILTHLRHKKLTWLEYGEKNPTDKVEPTDYNSIDPHFGKPTDKVEPKFKVKYAGCEYTVLEFRDFAGITYYGIEDEPNHFDYVKASNCEIISNGKSS